MQLTKAYKTLTVIEGLTKPVLVSIEWDYEQVIDFTYWDADLAKQTQSDIDAGRVVALYIQVRAVFSDLDGFEGIDSLGQVFVRPIEWEKDMLQSVEIHGMVENALTDLKKNVLGGIDKINTFLGKAA